MEIKVGKDQPKIVSRLGYPHSLPGSCVRTVFGSIAVFLLLVVFAGKIGRAHV